MPRLMVPHPGFEPGQMVSKTIVTANYTSGAKYLVDSLGIEPSEPKQEIYSLPLRRTGITILGGLCRIRTRNEFLLRKTCLPITPTARKNYRSRYRKLVCAAGFEPATPRFQGENSDLTELRTEVLGRG